MLGTCHYTFGKTHRLIVKCQCRLIQCNKSITAYQMGQETMQQVNTGVIWKLPEFSDQSGCEIKIYTNKESLLNSSYGNTPPNDQRWLKWVAPQKISDQLPINLGVKISSPPSLSASELRSSLRRMDDEQEQPCGKGPFIGLCGYLGDLISDQRWPCMSNVIFPGFSSTGGPRRVQFLETNSMHLGPTPLRAESCLNRLL